MKVLIMDTIHGADILAEKYLDSGYEVICADVYGKTDENTLKRISDMGAKTVTKIPNGNYDIVTSPAHCPDRFLDGSTYSEMRTFSDDVNRFIEDKRFRIEVTGVKGKTSSCYLIAHILSSAGKKVFLHTSRGQGPYANGNHKIENTKSIAPTSLLTLPEGDYDVMVCEVSLGGSGKADIACITNLVEDYGIAGNTRRASDAKACILSDKTNLVSKDEIDLWKRYGPNNIKGYGDRITVIGKPALGRPLKITVDYDGTHEAVLDSSYFSLQYIPAMELAVEVCRSMNISADDVIKALCSFKGVPGRGQIKFDNGKYTIVEKNPGISHLSIGMLLSNLEKADALEKAVIILDPANKKVCDKMDTDKIESVADGFGVILTIAAEHGKAIEVPADTKLAIHLIKEGFQ